MGNRAVVTFANRCEIEKYLVPADKGGNGEKLEGFVDDNPHKVGVYLHWNGGRDSIEAFCDACKTLRYRGAASDPYGVARITQTVCNFFGSDGSSCGVGTLNRLDTDNYDNGVYVVDDEWQIVGREFADDEEQENHDVEDFADTLVRLTKAVDEAKERILTEKAKQMVAADAK